jgi:hypothetical protein
MTGTGIINNTGAIQGIPSAGGASNCKPGQMWLAEFGVCINGCPPGTGWDGTTCQPTPYYGGPGGTGGSGLDVRGMPGLGSVTPLNGFLGDTAKGLAGGSAMLSDLRLDDAPNGYVGVWDATLKRWVATDPATFGGGSIVKNHGVANPGTVVTTLLATLTIPAAITSYLITGRITCTAHLPGDLLDLTATWTDDNNVAQTMTTGLLVTGLYYITGEITVKASTTINVNANVTGGAPVFGASATITLLG